MTSTPPAIDPFYAIAISKRAHELKTIGRSVIHMEFGQPSTGAPTAAIAAAHQVLDSDAMGYWESAPLKDRIAQYYSEKHGVAVSPDRIFLTNGASPALVLALHAWFTPGARIAIARPGYVSYRNVTRALSMEPLEIDCGPETRFQLSAKALAAITPAPDGVILSSPANPTGSVIPAEELSAIIDLCRERGIRIISDEIYHGLSYVGPIPSALEMADDAIILNSFSKYYSMAGWRLGWMVVPDDRIEAVRALIGNLFLTPPSLAQHAGLAAFDCTEELAGHIDTYRRNRDLMLEALPKLGLNRIAPPDGAFYIYADIGHLTDDSLSFCKRLLEDTGIATAPGMDFDPVNGNRFIRFSFAVSTAEVEEAISRLIPWFARQPTR
ncbi:MAG: aminotransferase class I/II-fold pyridoxal phosphate-dependent enzyme [Sphingobium sp.]|nr:aminotransferase class I/II-fold pyridoxal phosphate-dependent enzyme [Sphingobium sp.]